MNQDSTQKHTDDEKKAPLFHLDTWRQRTAALSFSAVVLSFFLMEFGDRGYPLDDRTELATNLLESDGSYDLSRLRLLTRCVGYIRSNYVDPARAQANQMLVSALDEVERSVPELLSDPMIGADGSIDGVTLQVGPHKKSFNLRRVTDLYTMNWKLLEIFRFIASKLSLKDNLKFVEYAAVNGMLRTLDPHSVLLRPQMYREMKLGTKGEFGGLGIVIALKQGRLVIQSVMADTPAAGAGLQSGDRIVQIGAESTVSMTLSDAVSRLRGKPGTKVSIWVMRKTFTDAQKFSIVRSRITLKSVTFKLLNSNVGYVRLKNFQQTTTNDLKQALQLLTSQARKSGGTMQGIVLDLRDNPGGLLDQAVSVSDIFLSDGNIVTTVGSGNRIREERVASQRGGYTDTPLVVLVNGGSASASEVVTGAIRNNNRGVIIGSRTFGKGSVQVLYDIDDAALKLTIAQYLTPGNLSIQGTGIVPHVALVPVTASREHLNLGLDYSGGESRLENHLKGGPKASNRAADVVVSHVVGSKGTNQSSDFEIQLASRMLVEAGEKNAGEMLLRAKPIFRLARREQMRKLVESLGKLNVDWNEGKQPVRRSVKAIVKVEPKRPVEAGQQVSLSLTVKNVGSKPLHRVYARSVSEHDAFDGRDFVLGRIPAGESRQWTVKFDTHRSMVSQHVPVTLRVFSAMDRQESEIVSAQTTVRIQGLPRPQFAYSLQVIETKGNGDGLLQPGERAKLRLRLKNVGPGAAHKTLVTLKNRGEAELFIHSGRFWVSGLASGEIHDVEFDIELKNKVDADGLQLEFRVSDVVLHQRMRHLLAVPFSNVSGLTISDIESRWYQRASGVVRSGASSVAGALGSIAANTYFYSSGQIGDWLRVPLSSGGQGWISTTDASKAAQSARVPNRLKLRETPQVVQPIVELTNNINRSTDARQLEIHGRAEFPWLDEENPPEIYIFNSKNKVYFSRVDGNAAAGFNFKTNIKLDKGVNKLAIYARAGRDLLYKRDLVILRRR